MDDVEREAQERGYDDGVTPRQNRCDDYGYTGHLADAYTRGFKTGQADYQDHMAGLDDTTQ